MVREPLEGSLRNAVEVGALAGGAVALALVGLALAGELLRHRQRAPRLVRSLDRLLPRGVQACAVVLATLLAATVGGRPAGADDSVRDWLRGSSGTATATTTVPTVPTVPTLPPRARPEITTPETLRRQPEIATPETIDRPPARNESPGLAPPPLVLEAPDPQPDPGPGASSPAGERYVVQRGDCLWSIAARRLGTNATNPAIDAAWRRIYVANRAAIGADPNLIHVGLVLVLPPLDDLP